VKEYLIGRWRQRDFSSSHFLQIHEKVIFIVIEMNYAQIFR